MPRENQQSNQKRRTFLKRAGIASTSLALGSGVASAQGKKKGKPEETASASSSISVGPDTPGLSKSEHDDYVARMREKYGDQGVWGSQDDGDLSTEASTPGHMDNLTYVNAWTEHLEATDDGGTVIAESDNQVALYKSDVKDEYDREHYFYWHWTSGQSRDYWDFTGNLWNMWNRVSLGSGYDMLAYDPDQDLTRNGKTYTVGLSAAYRGVGVSIEGDFTLGQDKVRPHPEYTTVGSDGMYAVQWIGDYEGTQAFNGTCEERRPEYAGRDFSWKVYLKAGKYAKV
ncbi:hypothetical protein [Halorussus caseinilyticus]|uniref:Twin-arginine translocation signal domain-containing protein n=1 Tax=Halorussus caseinilyticus TaxID=3034025 RepID=A0ABD5WT82_9EURY|nr:hypothetical protein [Halorussus sp. DT72]